MSVSLVQALRVAQATIERLTKDHGHGFTSTKGTLDVIRDAITPYVCEKCGAELEGRGDCSDLKCSTRRKPISWHDSYNIARDIMGFAEGLDNGLEPIATGGNIDYVARVLGKNVTMILACAEDAGSPDSLTDRALVSLQLCEDWTNQISFMFLTAREGLQFMASFAEADLSAFRTEGQ